MADTVLSALPVHVVGDSTAVPYDNRVFVRDGMPPFAFRSFYIGGARVARVGVALDTFAPSLLDDVFVAAQLVVDDGRDRTATHRLSASDPAGTDIARHWALLSALREPGEPWILLSYGIFDICDLLATLDGDDVELSPSARERWRSAPYCVEPQRAGATPWASLRHRIWWEFRALRTLVVRLRSIGFARIAIAAVQPPHPDDVTFAATVSLACNVKLPPARRTLSLRYKVVITANEVLAAICEHEDAHFVDAWPALTDNGVLRSEYVHPDQFHIADAGVRHAIAAFAERAYEVHGRDAASTPDAKAFAPGDWVVHDTIRDAALVTRVVDGGASVIVERPTYNLTDRWKTNRLRAATADEVAATGAGTRETTETAP